MSRRTKEEFELELMRLKTERNFWHNEAEILQSRMKEVVNNSGNAWQELMEEYQKTLFVKLAFDEYINFKSQQFLKLFF